VQGDTIVLKLEKAKWKGLTLNHVRKDGMGLFIPLYYFIRSNVMLVGSFLLISTLLSYTGIVYALFCYIPFPSKTVVNCLFSSLTKSQGSKQEIALSMVNMIPRSLTGAFFKNVQDRTRVSGCKPHQSWVCKPHQGWVCKPHKGWVVQNSVVITILASTAGLHVTEGDTCNAKIALTPNTIFEQPGRRNFFFHESSG
jgi:hypothetical protein